MLTKASTNALLAAFTLTSFVLLGCQKNAQDTAKTEPSVERAATQTTGQRIIEADKEPHNWLSHGRSYDEQRYSPLDQINDQNAGDLALTWSFDFPTQRGIEATPIVVDGVMYVTGSWSMVYAFDAKSGAPLWQYDPEVPRDWAVHLCCDVVNRGVALWDDKVFVGTLDGRSYVSAYEADSGEMAWRFYTVPGDPSQPLESPALERAATTWKGGEWWKIGGGGTVWDSMAYDPELNLLYIGVGNGSPWNREIRSPGGGDNLYLSSIVALNPDTGAYVWHYQTTPGDSWDYTAAQHMILADIEIDGRSRSVIMQAPKNGFFYVLDRATGELISAEKYTKVSWASRVDMDTGRPVLSENARYVEQPELAFPHPMGGHNWQPMSFSPLTKLVYIPAQELPFLYSQDKDFVYTPGYWNVGVDVAAAVMPDNPAEQKALLAMIKGYISAWDPVQQKELWRVKHTNAWNGGLLSTAGNVLFQGNSAGKFVAYRADSGEALWSMDAQTGIGAAPVTYAVDALHAYVIERAHVLAEGS